jgi:hypothetical protein
LSTSVTSLQTDRLTGDATCATLSTGGVMCWGNNEYGQLGVGSSVAKTATPTSVVGVSGVVSAMTLGYRAGCAKTTAGSSCWGYNWYRYFRADSSHTGYLYTPVPSLLDITSYTDIDAAESVICVRTAANTVTCWGDPYRGTVANPDSWGGSYTALKNYSL